MILFGTLLAAMAGGVFAGRMADTAEEFCLDGRKTCVWGIARVNVRGDA